jgi:hypothetical protein
VRQRERRGRAALCRRSGRWRGSFRCGCVGRIGGGRHRASRSRRLGPGLSNRLGLSKRRGARKHADGNDHRMAFRHVSHLPMRARPGRALASAIPRFVVLIREIGGRLAPPGCGSLKRGASRARHVGRRSLDWVATGQEWVRENRGRRREKWSTKRGGHAAPRSPRKRGPDISRPGLVQSSRAP